MTPLLTAVRTPADPSVVEVLLPRAARRPWTGSGPAILPVPDDDPGVRAVLVARLRPDDRDAPLEVDGGRDRPRHLGVERHARRASSSASRAMTWAADALHGLVGRPGTWLLALPAWHVGGLQVLTRSLRAGTTPVAMDLTSAVHGGGVRPAPRAVQARGAGGPTYASIVPTQLGRLLDSGPTAMAALAAYDAVLVGAAATPAVLVARAAVCRLPGRPVLRHERDHRGLLLRRAAARGRGRAHPRGRRPRPGPRPHACSRATACQPALTAETLVDGWLVTPDVGRLEAGRPAAGARPRRRRAGDGRRERLTPRRR